VITEAGGHDARLRLHDDHRGGEASRLVPKAHGDDRDPYLVDEVSTRISREATVR